MIKPFYLPSASFASSASVYFPTTPYGTGALENRHLFKIGSMDGVSYAVTLTGSNVNGYLGFAISNDCLNFIPYTGSFFSASNLSFTQVIVVDPVFAEFGAPFWSGSAGTGQVTASIAYYYHNIAGKY